MTTFRIAGSMLAAVCLAATPLFGQPATSSSEQGAQILLDVCKAVRDGGEAGIREAERLAAIVDKMPGNDVKLQANVHTQLGSYYRNADAEDDVVRHYSRVLALSDTLANDDGMNFRTAASANLAAVWVNRGDDKGAIATLDAAINRIRTGPGSNSPAAQAALEFLGDQRARYSMIGQQAPPLEGRYWLNAPPDTRRMEMSGRVRLLVFTAYWCAPCQKSYPALKRMATELGPLGFDIILATRLYGEVNGKRAPAEVELDVLRSHFLKKNVLPYPLAVEEEPPATPRETIRPVSSSPNERNYHTAGVPVFVVIDKLGVIRRIMFAGWDPANEPSIRATIRQLLEQSK
jgi:hypothetical protein